MASPITLTGSDLKSTIYPAALLEALFKLQNAEAALTPNPNKVQITINDTTKIISVTAQIPITPGVDASGNLSAPAVNYAGGAFVPGSTTIKSTSLPAVVLELASDIVGLEDTKFLANSSFTVRSFLAVDYNANNARLTGNYPFTTSLDTSGHVVITVADYL